MISQVHIVGCDTIDVVPSIGFYNYGIKDTGLFCYASHHINYFILSIISTTSLCLLFPNIEAADMKMKDPNGIVASHLFIVG